MSTSSAPKTPSATPISRTAKLSTLKAMRTVLRKKTELQIQKVVDPGEVADSRASVEETLLMLQFQSARLLELNEAIVDHDDFAETNVEQELENAENFSARVRAAIAKATVKVKPDSPVSKHTMFHSVTSTPVLPRSQHVQFELPSAVSNPGLPACPPSYYHTPKSLDISPEVFSGDRLRFRQFMTQFDRWTAKKPDITPAEKLMLLKKYVSGEPKTLIAPIELSDGNFQVAVELLETNYARVDTERQRILAEMRNLPRVPKPYDLPALRKLVTTVQRHTSSLRAIGVPITVIALSLRSSIEAALPIKIRQDFIDARRLEEKFSALSLESSSAGQTEESPEPNKQGSLAADSAFVEKSVVETEILIEFLKQRVRDLEDSKLLDAAVGGDNGENDEAARKTSKFSNKKVLHSTVLATTQKRPSAPARPVRPCLFCEVNDHSSSRCSAQLTVDQSAWLDG